MLQANGKISLTGFKPAYVRVHDQNVSVQMQKNVWTVHDACFSAITQGGIAQL